MLLLPNHVSWFDWLLLGVCLEGDWRFVTYVGRCAADAVATPDRESDELRWVDVEALPGNLHPAFAASWPEVKAMVLAQSA